jgi:hypothetical protein
VDLAETGTLIPRSETHVDDAFLRELTTEMEHITAHRGGGTEEALSRLGGLVFSHLLTETARRRLHDAEPGDLYLRLDERLVHVPWELCHDGDDFLLTKFRVGRQVITAQPIAEPLPLRADRDRLRILLVADPTESLPQATAEAEQLCALLDEVPGVDVTLLSGRSIRRIPLLAALQEHDVVHFAGHSQYLIRRSDAEWLAALGRRPRPRGARKAPPVAVPGVLQLVRSGDDRRLAGRSGPRGPPLRDRSAFLLAGVRKLRRHDLGRPRCAELDLRDDVLSHPRRRGAARRRAPRRAHRGHRGARPRSAHLGELSALRRSSLPAAAFADRSPSATTARRVAPAAERVPVRRLLDRTP